MRIILVQRLQNIITYTELNTISQKVMLRLFVCNFRPTRDFFTHKPKENEICTSFDAEGFTDYVSVRVPINHHTNSS